MSIREGEGEYWECDIDWTKAARERMFRALIECGSYITDFWHLGLQPRSTLFVMVWIPTGQKDRFVTIAEPYAIRNPPKIKLNSGNT